MAALFILQCSFVWEVRGLKDVLDVEANTDVL